MTADEILKIITDNFLIVRRLPFEVVSYTTYREGDENIKRIDTEGKSIEEVREVEVQQFDLDYFKNTPAPTYSNQTPEQRYEYYKKNFPNGRKLLKTTRKVENGGWWYVKQELTTNASIKFSRKDVFAPTLEEAVEKFNTLLTTTKDN